MKNLIIIGAGNWGLEIFSWLSEALGYQKEWAFKGFIDGDSQALKNVSFCSYPILGNETNYEIQPDDVFVCAIAKSAKRQEVSQLILHKGGKFINLIHKSVIFFKNTSLGTGCVIAPNCVISNNATIGNHVSINLNCTIGHDTKIGDYCQISSQCDITGYVVLGNHVFLGSSACIIPKAKIGNHVNIGAGSVVLKSIKDGLAVFGNPAKAIL